MRGEKNVNDVIVIVYLENPREYRKLLELEIGSAGLRDIWSTYKNQLYLFISSEHIRTKIKMQYHVQLLKNMKNLGVNLTKHL